VGSQTLQSIGWAQPDASPEGDCAILTSTPVINGAQAMAREFGMLFVATRSGTLPSVQFHRDEVDEVAVLRDDGETVNARELEDLPVAAAAEPVQVNVRAPGKRGAEAVGQARRQLFVEPQAHAGSSRIVRSRSAA
jgi:hypothetical protein